jgi:S1-C subfamily serine protease
MLNKRVGSGKGTGGGGLMVGDILTGLAGVAVSNHDELLSQLAGMQTGKAAQVEILRGGQHWSQTWAGGAVGSRAKYKMTCRRE